ncbi:hypothetical protein MMC25_004338 [Agyrium rufum]|nr:hypothetical protein [Agyrium rufum]
MPAATPSYSVSYSSIPLPIPSTNKSPYYTAPQPLTAYTTRLAKTPPSPGSSVNTSAVPSLTAGSYAANDKASSHGAANIDLIDMMSDRLSNAVNPLPLDRSLATQAQTSGELNAKQRELLELQALATRRLKGARANFSEGMKAAKEVKRDLAWTQKRVTQLNANAAREHPAAYKAAVAKYPSTVDS